MRNSTPSPHRPGVSPPGGVRFTPSFLPGHIQVGMATRREIGSRIAGPESVLGADWSPRDGRNKLFRCAKRSRKSRYSLPLPAQGGSRVGVQGGSVFVCALAFFRMYISLSWPTPEVAVPTGIARKGEDSARVHVRGNRTVTEPMVFISCSQCPWDPWEMSPFLTEPKAR